MSWLKSYIHGFDPFDRVPKSFMTRLLRRICLRIRAISSTMMYAIKAAVISLSIAPQMAPFLADLQHVLGAIILNINSTKAYILTHGFPLGPNVKYTEYTSIL
jgi:hypothetical protein